ncbi:MAG: helix-turn-helix domain-containing protein [Spirochaetes bacterium]|nr:helix-turn-helix domain-containing protein [Spirochaetota bacterium]
MESIGQKFKDARKEKGLFIEQVARETNISKRYIEAIEEENFEEFPGEAYLFGFLRSYASYLGLNSEEVINLYRNTKIQEEPIPNELIVKKRSFPVLPVAITAAVLLVAAGGTYLFINKDNFFEPRTAVTQNRNNGVFTGSEFEMNTAFMERRFARGDSVIVRSDGVPHRIIIRETSGEKVLLEFPLGTVELAEGEEVLLDITGDGNNDILIAVRGIGAAGRSAVLKFDRNVEAPAAAEPEITAATAAAAVTPAVTTQAATIAATAVVAPAAAVAPAAPPATAPAAPAATAATTPAAATTARPRGEAVILESATMQPFQVNLNFRRAGFVRYEADNGARVERFFNRGETFSLDVSREIRIWVSNAQAVSATINNIEHSFGTPGAVSAQTIGWSTSPSGGYVIRSVPFN